MKDYLNFFITTNVIINFFQSYVSDYFYFDEDYNVPQNATSTYPENILKLLADRMKRIENDDKSIIPLSRSNKEENTNHNYLDQKNEKFLNLNSITYNSYNGFWQLAFPKYREKRWFCIC